MRIKAIHYAGKADVYNLEVEDTHSFAVENGAIVHNCADEVRYMCMENPIPPRMIKTMGNTVYNPLDDDTQSNTNYKFYRM